jgi:site-specific DNA recombinase
MGTRFSRQSPSVLPVPAIVDEDTFDRVAQRLADNKRFASRTATVPSLLHRADRLRGIRDA